ncbi:hypothetical protein [Bacillus sp. 491mf]|uniref:hypothetical protein n=1 Tax=Bacillus sp. 491mf TaxID=1761755 RepID=UPI001C4346B9|nr:hypothetical protein [Bacillus sp. 491mf]
MRNALVYIVYFELVAFIALFVNTIIMLGVSMITRKLEEGHQLFVQKEETKKTMM